MLTWNTYNYQEIELSTYIRYSGKMVLTWNTYNYQGSELSTEIRYSGKLVLTCNTNIKRGSSQHIIGTVVSTRLLCKLCPILRKILRLRLSYLYHIFIRKAKIYLNFSNENERKLRSILRLVLHCSWERN